MKKIISIVLAVCMIIGCVSALAEIKNMPDNDADEAKVMYRMFMKTRDTREFTAFKRMLQSEYNVGQVNGLEADLDVTYHLCVAARIQSSLGNDEFKAGSKGDIYLARYTMKGGASDGMVIYNMIFPSTTSGKCLCVSVKKYSNANEALSYSAYVDDTDVETEVDSMVSYIESSYYAGTIKDDYILWHADCKDIKEITFSSEGAALIGALHD